MMMMMMSMMIILGVWWRIAMLVPVQYCTPFAKPRRWRRNGNRSNMQQSSAWTTDCQRLFGGILFIDVRTVFIWQNAQLMLQLYSCSHSHLLREYLITSIHIVSFAFAMAPPSVAQRRRRMYTVSQKGTPTLSIVTLKMMNGFERFSAQIFLAHSGDSSSNIIRQHLLLHYLGKTEQTDAQTDGRSDGRNLS